MSSIVAVDKEQRVSVVDFGGALRALWNGHRLAVSGEEEGAL